MVIGGWVGYRIVRMVSGSPPRQTHCSGQAYAPGAKVTQLLGPSIWNDFSGKVVLDFGCGTGEEAIEIARHGARRVIGLDNRESVLAVARERARNAGVDDVCEFTTNVTTPVDAIVSIDAFEHFSDPEAVLTTMRTLLRPGGRIYVAFGPPWFHPFGGHLFSVFPWAHLVFTEKALLRWRSEFKTDGARRFSEVDGGLNGMTVHRFRRLVSDSGCRIAQFEAVPIRRLRYLHMPFTREFFTSVVRCTLEQAAIRDDRMEISVERPHAEPQAGNTSDDLHQHVG